MTNTITLHAPFGGRVIFRAVSGGCYTKAALGEFGVDEAVLAADGVGAESGAVVTGSLGHALVDPEETFRLTVREHVRMTRSRERRH